jgi:PAS domain S-box-containing protein
MVGYTAAEAVGQSIRMIIPPERQAEEDYVLGQIRSGEKVDHFETVRQTKDGRRLDISLTVSPIRDGGGLIVGASKIARNISDRKQKERERDAALAQLAEALAIDYDTRKLLVARSRKFGHHLTFVLRGTHAGYNEVGLLRFVPRQQMPGVAALASS